MIDTGLRGRRALITGTDSPQGIGAATARTLAALGTSLFLVYLQDKPQALLDEIADMGTKVSAMQADLSDPSTPALIFDRAEATVGAVEILVNNAAASDQDSFTPLDHDGQDWAGRSVRTITAESHDLHFAVNSRATVLMMAEFGRRHAARGASWGRIINISTNGAYSFPGEASYGASKFALESFSRAAAVELGPFGITVNIVSPGPIQTGWIPTELEGEMIRMSPLGRLGMPEDVANVIVLAVSEQAGWMTGNRFYAGGGATM
jgi:3-oxoacyl-[acyl-carrier protein] reductase